MTQQETGKTLALIQSMYPNFVNGRDPKVTMETWQMLFKDDDYTEVTNAIMAFVATDTKGFAPSIGAIKERIASFHESSDQVMTEQQAWNHLHKVLSTHDVIYGYREEFDQLPEDIKAVVGEPSVLKDWAMMDSDEVNTVIASNFQRSYRARTACRHDREKLPQAIRQLLPSLEYKPEREERMALPEGMCLPDPAKQMEHMLTGKVPFQIAEIIYANMREDSPAYVLEALGK